MKAKPTKSAPPSDANALLLKEVAQNYGSPSKPCVT